MYGILHNGSKALIWPKYDCSIPVLNPRNLSFLKEADVVLDPPRGWSIKHVDGLSGHLDVDWVFITTINSQKAFINRSYDLPSAMHGAMSISQFSREGIELCLDQIPIEIENGKGLIILEDTLEWVMEASRGLILTCLRDRKIDLKRVRFMSSFKVWPEDIYFDAFESQSIMDFLWCKNQKSDYDEPERNPTKQFICLNRRCSPHRAQTYQQFIDRGLLGNSHFSYQEVEHWPTPELPELPGLPEIGLSGDTYEQSTGWPRNGFTEVARQSFNDSSYYLITETLFDRPEPFRFVTEKTYRAFLYQIPFIVEGNPGMLAYLDSIGYRVNFDGIGTGYNDATLSVSELLDRFQDLPVGTTSTEQCRHNYELYWRRGIRRCWVQTLRLLDPKFIK